MKKIYLAFVAIISLYGLNSCSSTTGTTAATTTTTATLNELFATLRPSVEYLTVNAGSDTVVYGGDSTALHFYANSFQDVSGNTITGAVTIQLTEIMKPGDFILSRMTTVTSDNSSVLNSGGAIYIVANLSSNGEQLYANKYGVGFKQAAASTNALQLYYGNTNNADTVTTWTKANSTTGTMAGSTTDSIFHQKNNSLYFRFDSCSSFNSVTCASVFSTGSALTNISVVVPSVDYTNANTEIFVVMTGNNVIVPVGLYSSSSNLFNIQYPGIELPVGASYELASITAYGTWLFYEQSGTVSSNMSITTAPTQATWTGLIRTIESL